MMTSAAASSFSCLLSIPVRPMPYSLRADDTVALLLLGCFLLSAYVLSRSRKFLFLLAKDFLLNRERTSIFATSTATDMRYLLLLVLQTCVLAALLAFCCLAGAEPGLVAGQVPSLLPAAGLTCVCLLALAGKWAVYSLVGWTFFGGGRTSLWLESYSTLLYYAGFVLYPVVLCAVYFGWGWHITAWAGVIVAVWFKIMIFYKWQQLFCNNLHGCFLLILYFCALEIVPCLILYRGVMQLTHYLIINN